MNLLIVNDYPTNLKLLRAQLEFEGHVVFEAYDGVDALALLERQRVDVVISDILMPRMDGYRLCQEIRRHARLRDLPIIIYTSTSSSDEKLALDVGADKYLKKPASVETLVAALHEVIAQPHAAPRPDALREVEVLKNYNERLVSKLKEKNTELQAAEVKFHALVEQSIVGIYITQDDQFVYVNPEMQKIFGWSEAEMTSRTLYDFIVTEEHALVREYIRKRISAEVPGVHYSLRMLHQSGAVLQVEVHGSRTDYNGRPAVMGMLVDITERKRAEEATQRSQKRLRDLIDGLGPSMFVGLMTVQGIVIECNRPALAAAGLKLEDVLGKPFEETYWWAYSQEVQQQLREAIARAARGEASRYDVQLRAAENHFIDVDFSLQPLRDETGEVVFLVPSANVITERTRAEALLKGQKRVLEMIVAGAPLGETLTALVRLIETHAPGMLGSILLLDEDGVHLRNGASPSLPPEYVTAIDGMSIGPSAGSCGTAAYNKEAVVVEDIATDPRWADYKAVALPHVFRACWSTPIFDAQRRVFGTFAMYYRQPMLPHSDHQRLIDVAVHAAAIAIGHIGKQERLNYLAYYDVLTGLANRTLFLERVAQYMRSAVSGGHQLALFLIDLERFKNINDSLGRPAGDDLLKQVAQWLTHNAAQDVNLWARVGTNHFALVMPVVKQGGNLMRLLEKWIEAFQGHPFRLNDAVFRIGVKVGFALFPDDGADADSLFKNAEAALKKAKASGERYLFYTQKMTSLVTGNLTLENQLHQALDKGEFVLHYQPKVNLMSGKMTSVEALIRWNDPRTGLVPPSRFIPILEETGLIHEVGRWALHQAIGDYLRWRAAGLPAVRIAVNVSPLQLRHRGFIAEIEQAIGIDAQAAAGLELEITENLIMEDVNGNIASLQAIRDLGVTIAIDDFGTGFSSLSYLAKLPVDTLKIDRSFVIDMTAGPQGLALVSTIINLGHALKLKVVAEGVETEEQSHLLRILNCDEMQGYLFSKPVPGEIFETRFLVPPADG